MSYNPPPIESTAVRTGIPAVASEATARRPEYRRIRQHSGMARDEGPRVGMPGRLEHVTCCARLDALASVDDVDLVAELRNDAKVVGNEEHRDAELVHQIAQQAQDLELCRQAVGCGRFIGKDQLWLACQRTGDQQALPLPAGKLMGVGIERFFGIRHLDATQNLDQLGPMLRSFRRACPPAAGRCARAVTHDLQKLLAHHEDRIEREIRILRNEADHATAHLNCKLAFRKCK